MWEKILAGYFFLSVFGKWLFFSLFILSTSDCFGASTLHFYPVAVTLSTLQIIKTLFILVQLSPNPQNDVIFCQGSKCVRAKDKDASILPPTRAVLCLRKGWGMWWVRGWGFQGLLWSDVIFRAASCSQGKQSAFQSRTTNTWHWNFNPSLLHVCQTKISGC